MPPLETKKDRQRFWMCLVDGTWPTKHRHWSREEAEAEAERLARETSSDVFLLEATYFVRIPKPTPPTEWKETIM